MRTIIRKSVAAAVAASTALGIGGISAISAGASGSDGVTNNQITIGATVPLSGIASAGYSDVAKAANAVFKYVNAKGGVNGRKINFIIKDDCYGFPGAGCTGTPNTTTQTQALLNTPGGLFATVGSLGTDTQKSVRNLLKSSGVPQLFVNSGSNDWNNPGTYPSLFGWQTDYVAEGKIFANYIKTNYKGKKVGFIGQDDDFGQNGLVGLQRGGLPLSNIGSGDSFGYSALAAVLSDPFLTQLTKLKNDGVQVVVLDTIAQATKKILTDAANLKYKPVFIISGVGSDPQTVNNKNEIGALTMTFFPATGDTKNSWNKWITKVLAADKADFPKFKSSTILTGNMQYGAGWAVTFLQLVKAMGSNVTQTNVVNTLENSGSTFATPAITQLAYSASNHQGLMGGIMVTVKSVTATTPVKNAKVYATTDADGSPLVVKNPVNAAVPAWLS